MPNYPYNYQPYQPYQPYMGPYYQQPGVPPYSGQPMPPQAPQTAPVQNQPIQTPPMQVQSGGTISVRSMEEARSWPVAPGNSVTFIDENAGYVYIKTSRNQFERPDFAVYHMEKVEDPALTAQSGPVAAPNGQVDKNIDYAEKADLTALAGVVRGINDALGSVQKDISDMKSDMYGVVGQKKTAAKKEAPKKEVEEDA